MNSISVYYTVLISLLLYLSEYVYIIDCSPIDPESILVITNYFFLRILSVCYPLYLIVLCIYNLETLFLCDCHIYSDHLFLYIEHTIPIFQSKGVSSLLLTILIKPCIFLHTAGPTFCKIFVVMPFTPGAFLMFKLYCCISYFQVCWFT
jgi:hypothetical protein